MRALHPGDALGNLDMHPRWNGRGVIIGGALNIDYARQHLGVAKKKAGAAIGAEMAPTMVRRCVNFGRSLRDFDPLAGIHRPAHHGCTGMPTTVRAMAKRVAEGLTLSLVANGATVTAALDRHAASSLFAP